jgi:hypothetical protein
MNFKHFYKIYLENNNDEDYLKLAKNPEENMEVLQKMINEKAKRYGFMIGPVYHGTDSKFTIFDTSKIGNRFGIDQKGFFFTINKYDVYTGKYKMSVFIKPNNFITNKDLELYGVSYKSDVYGDIDEYVDYNKKEIIKIMSDRKADTALITDYSDFSGTEIPKKSKGTVIAFFPNQIKLSDSVTYDDNGDIIPLSSRFDSTKVDIRY